MKQSYPKWIYHPTEKAQIIDAPPVPKGWFEHPDCVATEEKKIDDMTKDELEAHARSFGVELDRRKSKANMLKDFEDALK